MDDWESIHGLESVSGRQDCEATKIQAGRGSSHISETFHNGAKSPCTREYCDIIRKSKDYVQVKW